MSDPLHALTDIICSQVAALQDAYAKQSLEIPTLNAPFKPGPLEFDPTLGHIRHLIVAGASQLIATVQSPVEFIQDAAPAMFRTAALGFVVDVDIPEILMEAGPEGLNVKDIGAATGVDATYIARVLRYLATRHIFLETRPNVFTHNRHSTLLMKAKPVKTLKAEPIGRFDDAPFASFVHGFADETLASSSMLTSWLKQPGQAPAAFNIVYKTPKKMWDWLEEPENEWRARRFTAGMKGGADRFPPDIFVNGINGASLKDNDVVVDVGGSIGSATLIIKNAFPNLRYVVQDLEKQILSGHKFWQESDPEAIHSGQVKLQVHDFFTEQPVLNAAVYFLRVVIHDWSDEDAAQILRHLRNAAGPLSKLVIFDSLARHTCEDPNLEGLGLPKAPYPLLANLGVAGEGFPTALDMNMLTLFNGKERSQDDFDQLGKQTGWKLESVKPGMLSTFTFSPFDVST